MSRRLSEGSRGSADSTSRSPKRARLALASDRSMRDAALGGEDSSGRRRIVSLEKFREENRALKNIDEQAGTELRVRDLDFHVESNKKSHHTDEYELSGLILRRGQEFTVTVKFDREYYPNHDKVYLQFTTGSRPQESKGTLLRLLVSADAPKDPKCWHAQMTGHEGDTLTIKVMSSADSVVGKYEVFVQTLAVDEEGLEHQYRRLFDEEVIMLFNAWCPDDDVYMEHESHRQEYVMNESGRIWMGTSRSYNPLPWNFGQFDDVCLEAALYLMDKAELATTARSNPVLVVRTMSAMANSNDVDGGVLTGRWTETYPKNSTAPWVWTGSVAILEEFMKRKKAVRFGQCWVFSGLLTTLCRSLGIPTRSVTNFESAHDTDASMTIDFHWSEDDEPVEDLNDSVWNFHVWNESFFRRGDLPEGNDGWQAHDATPQELSEGVMQCGPSPVVAIKSGQVYLPYDTPFIFAEVNGDKVHWLIKSDGSMEPIWKERAVIGAKISTKAVGSVEREDLTHDYKYPEGTEDERKSVHRAFCYSTRREHAVYDIKEPEVKFELETPSAVPIGQDVDVKVKMINKVDEARNVRVRLSAVMSFYTGVTSEKVGVLAFTETVEANGELEKVLHIPAEDYQHVLKPEASMQIFLRGTVVETKRAYAHMESFNLVKPSLTVKAPETAVLGEEFEITMSYVNPLNETLTNVAFHIEAPGITKSMVVHHRGKVGPGEEVTETAWLQARRSGTKEIVVRFSSNQLMGSTGTAEIYVKYSE